MPFRRLGFFCSGVLLGLAVGGIAVEIFIHRKTLRGGDWMTFTGSLLGSGITVAGAIGLVYWQSALSRARNRDVLLELVNEVVNAAKNARAPRGDERFSALQMQETWARTLRHKIAVLKDTRQWIVPDSAAMARAFGLIGEMDVGPVLQSVTANYLHDQVSDISSETEAIIGLAFAVERELRRSIRLL